MKEQATGTMYFYGLLADGRSIYEPCIRFKKDNDEDAFAYASETNLKCRDIHFALVKYRGYQRKNGRLVIQECLHTEGW
jgi:hypothetical protein